MFAYYSFIVSLFVSAAVVWKRLLLLTGRGSQEDLDERLGRVVPARMNAGRGVVINAVSVGEMAEAESLICSLVRRMPDAEFVLTTGNADGRTRANQIRDRLNSKLTVMYLPWDRKGKIKDWLEAFSPALLVTLETDIWPNLFRACNELGIPVLIVNGRVYPKDVWRYKIAGRFFKRVFSWVDWIGAQGKEDFGRFIAIGAAPSRIEVVGNMKLAPVTVQNRSDVRLALMSSIDEQMLVAGSTHDPEEEWILDAFTPLRDHGHSLRLVLAPRHVKRSDSLSGLVRSRGYTVARWSVNEEMLNPWDVLILDQVGWLSSVYRFATVAIIGGSFVPKGGHNPAEAAIHGATIVIGPFVSHFEEMTRDFEQEGGIIRTTRTRLTNTLHRVIADQSLRKKVGSSAQQLVLQQSGTPDRYASAIAVSLERRSRALSERGRLMESITLMNATARVGEAPGAGLSLDNRNR